jgi:hypothetical protein
MNTILEYLLFAYHRLGWIWECLNAGNRGSLLYARDRGSLLYAWDRGSLLYARDRGCLDLLLG